MGRLLYITKNLFNYKFWILFLEKKLYELRKLKSFDLFHSICILLQQLYVCTALIAYSFVGIPVHIRMFCLYSCVYMYVLLVFLCVYVCFVGILLRIHMFCWYSCAYTYVLLVFLCIYVCFVGIPVRIRMFCWYSFTYTYVLLVFLCIYVCFVGIPVHIRMFCWYSCAYTYVLLVFRAYTYGVFGVSGRGSTFSRGARHVLFRAAHLPLVLTWNSILTCGSSKLLHATAATAQVTALASRLNQVRVADWSETFGEFYLGCASPTACEDWLPAEWADEITWRSNGCGGGGSKCCGTPRAGCGTQRSPGHSLQPGSLPL